MKEEKDKNIKVKTKNLNKGITLIALVITIIVLLILAAVSIATLTGENGILTRADDAKDKTEQASAEEELQLAVQGSWGTSGKIDIGRLNENLKKVDGISGLPISKLPNRISLKNETYQIDENGEISKVQKEEYREITTEESEKIGIYVDDEGILQVNEEVLNNYLQNNNGKLIIPSAIDGKEIKILSQALQNNTNLKEVTLSLGLVDIQWGAFQNCTNLQECNIPEGVTHIGNYVFNGTNMTSIFIPSTVTNIENKTTFLSNSIKNIMVDEDNNYYCDEDGLLLSKDKTILVSLAGGMQEITIPKEVTTIKTQCFYDNRIIKNINIENQSNLAVIEKNTFVNNYSLSNISLPSCFYTLESGNFYLLMHKIDFIVGSEEVKALLLNYVEEHGFNNIDEDKIIVDTNIN